MDRYGHIFADNVFELDLGIEELASPTILFMILRTNMFRFECFGNFNENPFIVLCTLYVHMYNGNIMYVGT